MCTLTHMVPDTEQQAQWSVLLVILLGEELHCPIPQVSTLIFLDKLGTLPSVICKC